MAPKQKIIAIGPMRSAVIIEFEGDAVKGNTISVTKVLGVSDGYSGDPPSWGPGTRFKLVDDEGTLTFWKQNIKVFIVHMTD